MKYWKSVTIAAALVISSSANAALLERLGGLAYYDDVANLTWLADANYAQTSGFDADGRMTWQQSMDWVADLTVNNVSGWRLANTLQPDASCSRQSVNDSSGYNCTSSEMGNMFYNVLGNSVGNLTNTGPFSIVTDGRINFYWSGTEYAPNTDSAWVFYMGPGNQSYYTKGNYMYSWAVQSGDVSAVPVPAAVWLFGSGLIGLAGLARRKKA